VIHRKLQNVVYIKKIDVKKKRKKEKKKGVGQHLKEKGKKKGGNIGSCPHVPVVIIWPIVRICVFIKD
jgi:hypothetical protein